MPNKICRGISFAKPCKVALVSGIVMINEGVLQGCAPLQSYESSPIEKRDADLRDISSTKDVRSRKNAKKNLDAARAAKKDEFYTLYSDIEREVGLYVKYNPDVFRDKVILLPCDDPIRSNFTKFFVDNFHKFGLKCLVSTCYTKNGKGRKFVLERDKASRGEIALTSENCSELKGDGDFRSEEVKVLRDNADVIITNPPFSLFREFFAWLVESKKKFLVIGSVNSLSYEEVYPHIMDNKVWLGHGIGRWISGFIVPEDYDLYGTETKIDENGVRIIASNSCLWLTNIDHGRRHQPLKLMTEAENLQRSRHKDIRELGYRKYDNCDAIEVPHTDAIPSDYQGLMGVPITFLDKFCPDQFELVRFRKGNDGKDLRIDGKAPYFRILIRAKSINGR